MQLEQLIPLLEAGGQSTQIDCNIKLPEIDCSTEWKELAGNLQQIITSEEYGLKVKLGGIRLLKHCLEAGSSDFNKKIQEGTFLEELKKYAYPQDYSQVDLQEQQYYSGLFFCYIVEGFLFWSKWFPGTKFVTIFQELKQSDAKSLEDYTLLIFKSENYDLYVNGQFKPKQGKAQGGIVDQQLPKRDTSQINNINDISAVELQVNLTAGEKVELLLEKYEQKKELMFGMLDNIENVDKLNQFIQPFIDLARITDGSLIQHQSINRDQCDKLIEKASESVTICSIFKSFNTQNITFPQLKQQLANIHKNTSKSAIQAEQQNIIIVSEVEEESKHNNESSMILQNKNIQNSMKIQQSSITFRNSQGNQSSLLHKIEQLLSSIRWINDSRLNKSEQDIINELEDTQNSQKGQRFSELNSKNLNDFSRERQIQSLFNFKQSQVKSQSDSNSNRRSSVHTGCFENIQESAQQRGGQVIKGQYSTITEEDVTLINEKKNNLTADNIKQIIKNIQYESYIDENLDEDMGEQQNIETRAVEYQFRQTRSKPVDPKVDISENATNPIVSQNNEKEDEMQREKQSEIQESENDLKEQSKKSMVIQDNNEYQSLEEINFTNTPTLTTQDSCNGLFGGKQVEKKNTIKSEAEQLNAEEQIIIDLKEQNRNLIEQIAQLKFKLQNQALSSI